MGKAEEMLVSCGEGEKLGKLISVAVWSGGNEGSKAESLIGCLPTHLSLDVSTIALHLQPGQTLMLHHKLCRGTTLTIR